MSFFSDLFRPPTPTAKPIQWRNAIADDKKWNGYIGDPWDGFKLFRIERDNFIETGETYCLHSQLSECICCFPSLEIAQHNAQQQWERLVKEGVTA